MRASPGEIRQSRSMRQSVRQRVMPANQGSAEGAIRGDPVAPGFDGQRRQIGIRHEISLCTRSLTKSDENPPMQTRSPGATGTQFGAERIASTNSRARAKGLGGSKTRGWVTTRRNPLRASFRHGEGWPASPADPILNRSPLNRGNPDPLQSAAEPHPHSASPRDRDDRAR